MQKERVCEKGDLSPVRNRISDDSYYAFSDYRPCFGKEYMAEQSNMQLYVLMLGQH